MAGKMAKKWIIFRDEETKCQIRIIDESNKDVMFYDLEEKEEENLLNYLLKRKENKEKGV